MRAINLVAALLVSGLAVSTASAAPVAPVKGIADAAPITDVQYYPPPPPGYRPPPPGYYHRPPPPPPPRYRPGYRYHSAPPGWHRYDRRPGDWRRRGCVIVGPMWFCP